MPKDNIVLIQARGSENIEAGEEYLPPMPLGYLAEALNRNGYENIKIVDLCVTNNVDREVLERADWIGISAVSPTFGLTKKVIKQIKSISKAPIILGGAHVTLFGKKVLENCSDIDYGVCGDGERNLVKLLSGQDQSTIEGLIYRKDGEVIANPIKFIEDLDTIHFPRYTQFDFDAYPNAPRVMRIVTSRGCPERCIYCCGPKVQGRKFRARSPENVVAEILYLQEKYGTKEIRIGDSNFTASKTRAAKICALIIREKLDIKIWLSGGIRADRVDRELLELLREAGVYGISFGVESSDPVVLKNIKKGITPEDLKTAIYSAKAVGLETRGFFMIGCPGDTLQKAKESVRFAQKSKLDSFNFTMAFPVPGTEFAEWAKREAILFGDLEEQIENYGNYNLVFARPAFETQDFTRRERLKAFRYASRVKQRMLIIWGLKKFFKGRITWREIRRGLQVTFAPIIYQKFVKKIRSKFWEENK